MKEWIPLFQSMIWPTVIVGFAFWFRGAARQLVAAIVERVSGGAPLEVGPSGIKVGTVQAPPSTARALAPAEDTRAIDDLPHAVYLTHQAVRDARVVRGGQRYYQLRISVDADEPKLLDDVEKVVYHLHPTFPDPDRTSTDRKSGYEIRTAAWGEFNMTAEILFREGKPKLVVERYINFPAA